MRVCMLTTVDNPFDPFDNFEEWFKIDMQFQYNTCALVARLVPDPAISLPDSYNEAIKQQILERFVAMQPQTYKLVYKDLPDISDEEVARLENAVHEEISESTL